jgi:CHAT domain-containing protein/tetratricopeptide (TPR) repeat protein
MNVKGESDSVIQRMTPRTWKRFSVGLVLLLFALGVVPVAVAQEGSLQDAEALSRQVLQFYQQGRFNDAVPLALQALEITEKARGPEHPETAASLNNLALLYEETGAYAQAEPLYRRALAINEKALGRNHPATAEVLNNLAELYRATGAYAQAEPLYQQALAIREKALGHNHPDTARSFNTLATLYLETGAYAQAEPLYQQALAIREKALGPEHPLTAASLNNLAALYRTMGSYAQAEPLFRRAVAIAEKVLGPEHPNTAASLNNLALLYQEMGSYAQAEPFYRRALAINEKALGPEHPRTADSLNNLAELNRMTGAYAQAEPLYRRSLAINEKARGPEHPRTAASLENLAQLYRKVGSYAQAEPLYRRALAIREHVLGPDHPDTAESLDSLAELYHATGAYAQAEPLYQQALEITEMALGPEHPETSTLLNNLAGLYQETGAYAQAEPLYRRALAIREHVLGPDHPDTADLLNNLAALRWAMGELGAALSLLERAHAIETKNTAGFLLTGSESRKRAYLAQVRGSTFSAVSLAVTLPNEQARALGLRSVLEVKGRVLDAMSDSAGRLRQSVKPEDRTLLKQLVAVAQQSSTLLYQGPGSLSPEMYRQRIDELAAKQTQLEAELSTRSAAFRQEVAPITLAAVQAAIPKHAALVEWFRFMPFDPHVKDQKTQWGKPRYVAYVLRHEGEPAVVDIGEAAAIEALVQDFRTALSDPKNAYVSEVAQELSDKLLKPLRPSLSHTEHLLLAPDGALHLVPFAALKDETGSYLATRVELSYLTTGRDLVRATGPAVANGKAVVVANPDYGQSAKKSAKKVVTQAAPAIQSARSRDLDRGDMTFRPLKGTAKEAKALTALLKVKKEDLLTQGHATEAKVKQLHGPRMLHIATHGFFLKDNELPTTALRVGGFSHEQPPIPLGENPLLRSGLALAGANLRRSGEQEDGILTAAEVAQMDLRGTQLVVLSACETGVGDVQNGEGVYGLRRALVLAGAETQVASLWKVADNTTKDLMVEYYQRLLKGEGRSAALRAAQRTMLTSQTRAHPYYWAAFVPIGRWTPLTQRQ